MILSIKMAVAHSCHFDHLMRLQFPIFSCNLIEKLMNSHVVDQYFDDFVYLFFCFAYVKMA
jgi:hypothetical protein